MVICGLYETGIEERDRAKSHFTITNEQTMICISPNDFHHEICRSRCYEVSASAQQNLRESNKGVAGNQSSAARHWL
jgi:hypothetical protein